MGFHIKLACLDTFFLLFYFSDGLDFSGPTMSMLKFPVSSNPGTTQCISITLLFDNFAETTENFLVELRSNDSAVMIPSGGHLVIIDIRDMPNPQGKELDLVHGYYNVYKVSIRPSSEWYYKSS